MTGDNRRFERVNNPDGPAITAVGDPCPSSGEALVAVPAFSVNRGELALLQARTGLWRPGQDIAGVVVEPAADGAGPAAGTRIVALVEQAGWAELAAGGPDGVADAATRRGAAGPPRPDHRGQRWGGPDPDPARRYLRGPGHRGRPAPVRRRAARPRGVIRGRRSRGRRRAVRPGRRLGRRPIPGRRHRQGGAARNRHHRFQQHRETPISIHDFFGHEGARVVSYLSYAHPEPHGPDLTTLAGLVADGRLDPAVSLTLPWTRLRDALTALAERRTSGKAVLTIS